MDKDLHDLKLLLRSTGPNLETMEFEFRLMGLKVSTSKHETEYTWFTANVNAIEPLVDLSALIKLQSIRFTKFRLIRGQCQHISYILRSINSDCLHSASFALYLQSNTTWKAEVDILIAALQRIASLRRVRFEMYYSHATRAKCKEAYGKIINIAATEIKAYLTVVLVNLLNVEIEWGT